MSLRPQLRPALEPDVTGAAPVSDLALIAIAPVIGDALLLLRRIGVAGLSAVALGLYVAWVLVLVESG